MIALAHSMKCCATSEWRLCRRYAAITVFTVTTDGLQRDAGLREARNTLRASSHCPWKEEPGVMFGIEICPLCKQTLLGHTKHQSHMQHMAAGTCDATGAWIATCDLPASLKLPCSCSNMQHSLLSPSLAATSRPVEQ